MNLDFLNASSYLNFLEEYSWLLGILAIWSIVWKGFALWRAAERKEKWWFIALLIINTFGILEILYIFVFGKKESEA